jgi:hypothetical protein
MTRIVLANLLFWSGLATGAPTLAALLEVTGARWAGPIRARAASCAGFLPIACLVLVVLAPAMPRIFDVEDGRSGALAWVAIRDAVALALLYGACVWFIRRPRTPSAAVLILASGAASTLIAIDLVMRFDSRWMSTLFPLYVAVTNLYAGIAAVAIVAALPPSERGATRLDGPRAHDLARLLLGLSLVWLYLFWSQYLVIWYGNLPDEFTFMLERTRGPWHPVAIAILVCCAGAPCALLIARHTRATIVVASGFCLVGVWLERLLLVFAPHAWHRSDVVVAACLTAGFAFMFALSTQLKPLGSGGA